MIEGAALGFIEQVNSDGTLAHWAPAGNFSYLTDAQNFYQLHLNEESGNDGELLTDWNNVYWASNVLLANLTNTGAYHTAVQVRSNPPSARNRHSKAVYNRASCSLLF